MLKIQNRVLKGVLLSGLVLSGIGGATAATTVGNLNFTFQGVVPASPVTPASWSFVDVAGTAYVPTTVSLSAAKQTDGSYILATSSPVNFGIKVSSGSTFTTSTNIGAALISTSVSGSGIEGSASSLTPSVVINGTTLTTSNATVAPASGSQVNLALTLSLPIPKASISAAGGGVSVAASVVFSVDITTA